MQEGSPNLNGDAGKAGARTDIEERERGGGRFGAGREEMLGSEERFAEVASHDLRGLSNGGQIGARIPAQEKVEVGLKLGQLDRRKREEQKGLEEGGDASGIHWGGV